MQLSSILVILLSMIFDSMYCFIDDEHDPALQQLRTARDKAKLTAQTMCAKPSLSFAEGVIDEITKLVPRDKVPETCTNGWDSNGVYWDKMCMPYPTICQFMPAPQEATFAVFTEPFPCWSLAPCVIGAFEEMRDETPSTPMKCMMDFVIAFFFACYPGMDPVILYGLTKSGKLATGGMSTAQDMIANPPEPPSPF